ncbi:MAG: hypothetical protein Tsb0015_02780 [Simkaniaceae bacterium]
MKPVDLDSKEHNYKYYCNDGVITRADQAKGVFETRSFATGEWKTTKDPKLIQKMIMAKRQLPSQQAADQLFQKFKKSMESR